MPPFKLSDSEMDATLAFLGSLTAPAAQRPVDGAVDSGRQFFFGKGNCSSCHMIGGRGGVLGPDLSNLAAGRRLAQIEQALRNPGAQPSYKVVTVRFRNGRTLRGLAK